MFAIFILVIASLQCTYLAVDLRMLVLSSFIEIKAMGILFQTLTLRPYGNHLLTVSGRFSLVVANVLIVAIAIVEGFAWGYFGSSLSASYSVWSGLLVAIMAVVVTWCIDCSLITYDSAKAYYEEKIFGHQQSPSSLWHQLHIGSISPYVLRIAFAIGSMTITAPYLSQAIFSIDIAKQTQAERDSQIATGREHIQNVHSPLLVELQQQMDSLSQQLTYEVSGKKGSGKYGAGPVARSIEAHLQATQLRIKQQQAAYDAELNAYDQAIQQADETLLAKKWHINLIVDSPKQRELQMQKIAQTPAYIQTKQRIYGGLILLIVAFLTLKMLPNRSLKIYFSDVLQQEWLRYQQGAFDDWLDEKDKSHHSYIITPNRFEYLMLHFYVREQLSQQEREARESELKAQHLALQKARAETLLQQENERHQQQALAKLHNDGTAGLAKLNQLSQDIALAIQQKAGLQTQLDSIHAVMEQLNEGHLKYPARIEAQQRQVDKIRQQRSTAEKMLAEQHATQHTDIKTLELLHKLTEGTITLEHNYQHEQEALSDLNTQAQQYENRLAELQQQAHAIQAQLNALQQHAEYLDQGKGHIWQRLADSAIDQGLGKQATITPSPTTVS